MFSDRIRSYRTDIVDDADRLSSFVEGMTVEALIADDRTLLAVERLFQRITEAVIQIGATEMDRIGSDLPFRTMRNFGNRLRHDYRNIDPVVILRIARTELPILRNAALRALES